MPFSQFDRNFEHSSEEVLIVDDRAENLLALESLLVSENYNVIKCLSAREALKYLLEFQPSVILLDVQMPDIDGFEAATLIKQNPRTRDIPIIFITALDHDDKYRTKGYLHGAIDYIQKPFDSEILRSKVSLFVNLSKKTRDLLTAERALKEAEKRDLRRELAELEVRNLKITQAENKRYMDLVNSLDHAIVWTCDPTLMCFKFISANIQRFTGKNPEELVGEVNLVTRITGITQKHIENINRNDTPQEFQVEHHLETQSGEIRWFNSIIQVNSQNDMDSDIKGVSVDITGQKRLAHQLLRENRTNDFLIESSQLLSRTLDLREGLDNLFENLLIQHFSLVKAEITDQAGVQKYQFLYESESYLNNSTPAYPPKTIKIEFNDKELGEVALLPSSEFLLLDSNRFYSELGHQISSFAEMCFLHEEANKAIRMRDDFLSVASHELRTPLTPLKLQAQLLRRMLLADDAPLNLKNPQKIDSALCNFDRQLDKLTLLVDELLDISRMANGKLSLSCSSFELVEMLTETLERFATQLQKAGCDVVTYFPNNEFKVSLDKNRVDQIFTNLLTNAIKYGAGSEIHIRLEEASDGNGFLLTVKDFGMGISDEDQFRVFGRFERAVNGKSITGLGLGLFIAKQIVDAHRGSISVKSTLGEGAEFRVYLPKTLVPDLAQNLNYLQ